MFSVILDPDTPGIADMISGDTSLNVSWTPTADGQRQENPGQEFYVEIRKVGGMWNIVSFERFMASASLIYKVLDLH